MKFNSKTLLAILIISCSLSAIVGTPYVTPFDSNILNFLLEIVTLFFSVIGILLGIYILKKNDIFRDKEQEGGSFPIHRHDQNEEYTIDKDGKVVDITYK